MANAVYNQSYEPSVYNALGHLELVDKLVTEAHVLALGKIIIEHGHHNEVVAIKAHRHFDLAPTEAMLEKPNADGGSNARPCALEQIVSMDAVPSVVALDQHGARWFPVNFAVREIAGQVGWLEDEAFLKRCAEYLRDNALADKLMLGARDVVDGHHVETNRSETRTSELRPVPVGMKTGGADIACTYKFGVAPNGTHSMVPVVNCAP